MRQSGRSNSLVLGIVILVVILVVVLIMWQRDRESTDLNIDIGALPVPALHVA
ncbi:MAG: hypothetical protein RRA92_05110 [Gemmatimonadota bacterium]|nr:hypothetical protein [Gemmatimonadota bacterium]